MKWFVKDPESALAAMRKWRGVQEDRGENRSEFVWNDRDGTLLGLLTLDTITHILELKTHSEKRFTRWKKKLAKVPGLKYLQEVRPSTSDNSDMELEDEFEPSDAKEDLSDILLGDDLAHVGRQFFEKWMRDTLDSPVPALGNLTPRDCCKTPQGKRKVRDWIDDYENHLASQAGNPLMRQFDMDEVRRRLGLN